MLNLLKVNIVFVIVFVVTGGCCSSTTDLNH